jgi:hypothetical protein
VTPIVSPEDLRRYRVVPSRKVQVVDEELPTGQLGIVRVDLVEELPGISTMRKPRAPFSALAISIRVISACSGRMAG